MFMLTRSTLHLKTRNVWYFSTTWLDSCRTALCALLGEAYAIRCQTILWKMKKQFDLWPWRVYGQIPSIHLLRIPMLFEFEKNQPSFSSITGCGDWVRRTGSGAANSSCSFDLMSFFGLSLSASILAFSCSIINCDLDGGFNFGGLIGTGAFCNSRIEGLKFLINFFLHEPSFKITTLLMYFKFSTQFF